MKLNDSIARILNQKGSVVHSISQDATVFEALKKLAEKNIGALVVLNGTVLVGVFSERDYARKVILKDRSSREIKVHEIITCRWWRKERSSDSCRLGTSSTGS
jgi:CBS domain-containing protein